MPKVESEVSENSSTPIRVALFECFLPLVFVFSYCHIFILESKTRKRKLRKIFQLILCELLSSLGSYFLNIPYTLKFENSEIESWNILINYFKDSPNLWVRICPLPYPVISRKQKKKHNEISRFSTQSFRK